MRFTKVISSFVKNTKMLIKVFVLGNKDVQTPVQVSPYGVDGNPIKDMIALYAPTNEYGQNAIVGYIHKNYKAEPGELRLFCTDTNGAEKFFVWLKKDGSIEIGGNADNAVRYSPLNTAMTQLQTDINTQLALISAGISAAGGSYTPGNISIDISGSKIDDIKTT